jgi:hypothetical protein
MSIRLSRSQTTGRASVITSKPVSSLVTVTSPELLCLLPRPMCNSLAAALAFHPVPDALFCCLFQRVAIILHRRHRDLAPRCSLGHTSIVLFYYANTPLPIVQ